MAFDPVPDHQGQKILLLFDHFSLLATLKMHHPKNSVAEAPASLSTQACHSTGLDRTVIGYGNIFNDDTWRDESQAVIAQLTSLAIPYRTFDVTKGQGGVIIAINAEDRSRLPTDDRGSFLPADQSSGHNLVELQRCYVDLMCGTN